MARPLSIPQGSFEGFEQTLLQMNRFLGYGQELTREGVAVIFNSTSANAMGDAAKQGLLPGSRAENMGTCLRRNANANANANANVDANANANANANAFETATAKVVRVQAFTQCPSSTNTG